jgi:WD40 repeat protein
MRQMVLVAVLCSFFTVEFPFRALAQNTSSVTAIDWSADGTRLAIGHQDGILEILDVPSSQILLSYPPSALAVNSVAWSPAELNIVAVSTARGTLDILDVTDPQYLISFDPAEEVRAIAWSPDGTQLASTSARNVPPAGVQHKVNIWNATTGELVSVLEGQHTNTIISLAWSPDGTRLASGSTDSNTVVWDVSTATPIIILEGDNIGSVNALAWSPDGSRLATSNLDIAIPESTLRIGDVASGQPLVTYMGSFVRSISWRPNAEQLAVADGDTVLFLDAMTGEQIDVIQAFDSVHSVDWHPAGEDIAYDVNGSVLIVAAPMATVYPRGCVGTACMSDGAHESSMSVTTTI